MLDISTTSKETSTYLFSPFRREQVCIILLLSGMRKEGSINKRSWIENFFTKIYFTLPYKTML